VKAGWTSRPPTLLEQPIFYPVLDEDYAGQIARDWNPRHPSTDNRGYITRFRVRAAFLARRDVMVVGR
jgi:hypothetical protein